MSSEPERDRALVGTTVDERYRFDDVIATGAMGTVYLGRHLKLKKRVAIKVLHPDVDDHPELVLRFEREALAGAQVGHPNVACATDFGDLEGGARYLVMEYVKGDTLRTVLDKQAPLEPKRAVKIARQIAAALEHVHDRGIVHRDLKPRNVMLGENDFVKVVDFGLAKIDGNRMSTLPADEAEEDSRLTTGGVIFGTIEYLAPEAAFGMELVDQRADLYALGVVLYEMLTGKHPFDAKTEAELFAKQRHADPPKMAARAPGIVVPDALQSVVDRLLHKDFDERYQSAAEVQIALDAALPASAAPVPVPESQAVPVPDSRPEPEPDSRPEPEPDSRPEPEPEPEKPKRAPTGDRGLVAKKPPKKTKPEAPAKKTPAAEPPPPSLRASHQEDNSRVGLVALVAVAAALIAGYLMFAGGDDPAPRAPPAKTSPPAKTEPPPPTPKPTATATATAVPTASAAPSAAPPPDPAKVRDILGRIRNAFADSDWSNAADETLALLAADPAVLRDASASGAVSEMLAALHKEEHARADEVWRAVALAEGGADLVYRYIESGGKASLAERARKLLADPKVSAGASDAVNIAFELREAPCDKKAELLDRAVEEGDQRAEVVIDILVRGCMKNQKPVDAALDKMRKKRGKK